MKKILAILMALLTLASLAACGGDSDNVAVNGTDTSNEMIVKTGLDDIFGGVAFNLTIDEFVEAYNKQVDQDSDTSTEAELNYLYRENFSESTEEEFLVYKYSSFNLLRPADEYALLRITVNVETKKVQYIEYICALGSSAYYSFEIPARVFSVIDPEVKYPAQGDYSSYENRFIEILNYYENSDSKIFFDNNISYKFPDAGDEDFLSIAAIACTESSKFMIAN